MELTREMTDGKRMNKKSIQNVECGQREAEKQSRRGRSVMLGGVIFYSFYLFIFYF